MSLADEYNIKPGPEHLPVQRPVYYSGDSFGDFIRRRRINLGLSARTIAERVGVHNAQVSRWERGEQRPDTLDVLPILAEALDVPLAELCAQAGDHLGARLPHLSPYLHLKYGRHVPTDVLDDLVDHCEQVLGQHPASEAA